MNPIQLPISVFIPRIPPSLNKWMGGQHPAVRGSAKRLWKRLAWEIMGVEGPSERYRATLYAGPVFYRVIFYPPDKRHRDLDNYCMTAGKMIADAMTGVVIVDDRQVRRIIFDWGADGHEPGIMFVMARIEDFTKWLE